MKLSPNHFEASVARPAWTDVYTLAIALVSAALLIAMLYTAVTPMPFWRLTGGHPDLWWWSGVVAIVLVGRRLRPRARRALLSMGQDSFRLGRRLVRLHDVTMAEICTKEGQRSLVIQIRGGGRLFESTQLQLSAPDGEVTELHAAIHDAIGSKATRLCLMRGHAWQAIAVLAPFFLGGCAFASIPRLGFPLQAVVALPWALAATIINSFAFGTTVELGPQSLTIKAFEKSRTYTYEEIRGVRRDGSRLSLLLATGKVVALGRAASPFELEFTQEAMVRLNLLHQLLTARLANTAPEHASV